MESVNSEFELGRRNSQVLEACSDGFMKGGILDSSGVSWALASSIHSTKRTLRPCSSHTGSLENLPNKHPSFSSRHKSEHSFKERTSDNSACLTLEHGGPFKASAHGS